MYNRQFYTTAGDRRRRMMLRVGLNNNQTEEGVGAARMEPNSFPPPLSESQLAPVSVHATGQMYQLGGRRMTSPDAHSTNVPNGFVPQEAENLDHSGESMDLENEQPRQAVTFDPSTQSMNVQQLGPDPRDMEFWSIGANSDATQYRDIFDNTRHVNQNPVVSQRLNPSQTNPFLPGYGTVNQAEYLTQAHPAQEINVPYAQPMPVNNVRYQLVPHFSQNVFAQNPMSKTERTVLMELLQNVGTTDGSDDIELLNFLKALKPLFDIAPSCSDEIVKLIVPKTRGQLFRLWIEATTTGVSWENLHSGILSYFLPAARLREIEALELDRPQRPNETFVEYAENIIAVAFALRTKMSEQEVIEIILSKCHPVTKGHFAFNSRPNNIGELKVFANKVTGSIKSEMRYFGMATGPSGRNVMQAGRPGLVRQNAHNFSRPTRQFGSSNNQRERIIKCYKCNGEGHMARNCSSLNY